MKNRRNYYRMLHVQPDAPLDIIKASYRALMMKMRLHPDLGGDHETAALINRAYTVLSDPAGRRLYDQALRERDPHVFPQAHRCSGSVARAGSTSLGDSATQPREASPTEHGRCVFCNTHVTFAIRADCRCPRCASPLAQPYELAASITERYGRRAVPRLCKDEPIVYYPRWPHQGYAARLRDLSPSGISFFAQVAVELHQPVKISGATLEGVARVVSSHPVGSQYSVHAQLLTVLFLAPAGTFVSSTV
jgi:curved DNA-binding protein CbpA